MGMLFLYIKECVKQVTNSLEILNLFCYLKKCSVAVSVALILHSCMSSHYVAAQLGSFSPIVLQAGPQGKTVLLT